MNGKKDKLFETYCQAIKNFSDCMDDYLYVYDLKKDQYYISERAVERFALPSNCFSQVADNHKKFVYADDYEMLMEDINKMKSGEKERHDLRYRWIGKDGRPIWIICRGSILYEEKSTCPRLMIGCINEIGKQQKADNISGLLREEAFQEWIGGLKKRPQGYLLRIGIDNFKKINERLGLRAGDTVLYQVANCIRESLKDSQQVYRLVADEFLIVDANQGKLQDAKDMYRYIRSRIDKILEEYQYAVLFTISGGILEFSELEEISYEEILKYSQFALSQAKENGRNQYYHLKKQDYEDFLKRKKLERELRKAVSRDGQGFELNYQPIVNPLTGEVYAAEALLRFQMEDGKNVSPMVMIPLLEKSGLIIPVGKWVLKNALKTCMECREVNPDFRISVNLSYVQITKSSLVEDITAMLEENQLSSDCLIVEMTESGKLEESAIVKNVWNSLKQYGIHIAVDDFGSGYSNLRNLGELRPNLVKIDRQFTMKAMQNEFDFRLLNYIIKMAHDLDLDFVVEGIETKEELQRILAFKPDYIQGYYYGKPSEKEEFIREWIKK